MNPQQVQQIIDALNHAAGGAWQALVSQEKVSGFQGIAWCGLMFLAGLIFTFVAVKIWKKARQAPQTRGSSNSYGDRYMPILTVWLYVGAAFSTTAALVFLVIAPLLVVDAIGHIVNPAGYAIKDLLGR